MNARSLPLLVALGGLIFCARPSLIQAEDPPVMIGLKAELATASDRERQKFDGDGGLIVLGILPDGPADQAGLQVGDLLVVVNGRQLSSLGQLHEALREGQGAELKLDYLRDGFKRTARVTPVTRRDLDLLQEEAKGLGGDGGLGGLLKNFSASDLLNLGDLEIEVRRGGSDGRSDAELERAIERTRDPIAIYGRINVGQLLGGLWSGDKQEETRRLELRVEQLQREVRQLQRRLEALEPSPSSP